MKDWKQLAIKKPVKAYSYFCGVLEYSESILDEIKSGVMFGFNTWEPHVNPDNIEPKKIISGFNRFYYESFVNCVFPDLTNSDKHQLNKHFAEKTVRLSKKINQTVPITIKQRHSTKVFNIKFEYLDLYFFPRDIVFYCFKCDLTDFTFNEITLINNYLRNSGVTDELKLIYDHLTFLTSNVTDDLNSTSMRFGNKLKIFSLIEHDEILTIEEEDMFLYDLGVCAPIGSASGENPFFQPSDGYFQDLIINNKISVFKNWSALTLFDTFTGFFQKGAFDNFIWENGYFNLLYLQSLYVKNYFFKINKIFYNENCNHQELEDEFFEFSKYYNPSHISYNFLPAIIFNQIRNSLAVNDELSRLKEGIERANQKAKEKRDKMINDVLTVIALLAVFSIIWDLSEWINKLFSGGTFTYNVMSGTLTLIVVSVIIVFLLKNYRKK